MFKNTLQLDSDFDLFEKKLKQYKLLLLKIEKKIKNGASLKSLDRSIKQAKKLRDECDKLKSNIQYNIKRKIN